MGLPLSHFQFFELTHILIAEVNQWIFFKRGVKDTFCVCLNSLISDIAIF